ncbi:hypothetical protein EJ03DRAFT_87930 [Teratosphaeria nubilosa]|uniref:Rhodopsin domain-containing protein n=1 Tax=Teratosphaeria nubilosa TaxID=161662 RepID=A0A6G1LBG2_9PEZI|nr:hypothetical protein EJ03DRAFT_87930 [Teratosphaeria nubilosa]
MKQEEVAAWLASSHLGPEAGHFGANDLDGWKTLCPALALALLATITVALRRYTRNRITLCPGWDDVAIECALLVSWAMTILLGVAAHDGVDLQNYSRIKGPADESYTHELSHVVTLVIANNSLWAATVSLTKCSILLQYLRVFAPGHPTRHLSYVLLTAVLVAALWAILGGPLICTPVKKLWDPTVPGTCVPAQTYWSSVASIDIILDLLILTLPLPAVASLRLPRRQRISLLLVFILGFTVCGFSVARLATVITLSDQGEFRASGFWAVIWSVVEANVGVMCSCLLALRPLLLNWFPGLDEDSGREATRANMHLNAVPNQGMVESGEARVIAQNASTTMTPAPSASWSNTMAETGSKATMSSSQSSSGPEVRALGSAGQERYWE